MAVVLLDLTVFSTASCIPFPDSNLRVPLTAHQDEDLLSYMLLLLSAYSKYVVGNLTEEEKDQKSS